MKKKESMSAYQSLSYVRMGRVLEIVTIIKKLIREDTVYICDYSTVRSEGKEIAKVMSPDESGHAKDSKLPQSSYTSERK